MRFQFNRLNLYAARVRRSSAEIAVAAALTLAALAFLGIAFIGSNGVNETNVGPVAAGEKTVHER